MVHADLDKDVNSYYTEYQNTLQKYEEKRGIKITRRLTDAKREKKDTQTCRSKYKTAIQSFYTDSVNHCWNPCITSALANNDYQAAVDCCSKKYEDAKSQWNTDLDKVDDCIDKL
ncbi:uncharacterized protein LOC117179089 [Belonocnema kinseyi]|uniref:uncharacterized protein LOC117179089 n=1 Tax=Belonocnema kinseyi TaxID=2817044 RepID=UPI00143CF336|nr:uncharacterized protein LOC117179089 [Belonocnema kinseyi]